MTEPITTVYLDDSFRDRLVRALISISHAETVEQIIAEMGESDCGGQTFDPPCGGCTSCVIAQQTYSDWTREGQARWIAQADQIVEQLNHSYELSRRLKSEGRPG